MTMIRAACLALALSTLCAVLAAPAQADEAAQIYDPSKVVFVGLALSTEAEAKLEAEPGEYVKGNFSMS